MLADAIIQYTQLALQLANLTATSRASLVRTPVPKHVPTDNKRGRPTAMAVVARTNHRVDEYYRKKPLQSDAQMSRPYQEEEKKQGAAEDDVMEFIDTSSNPQPMPSLKP